LIQFLCHPERRKKPTEEREIAILAVLADRKEEMEPIPIIA
jgi:hypothetical protein